MDALQNASVTAKEVHFFSLILSKISSASASMISSSAGVKCPELFGIVVKLRGRLVRADSGSRYFFGIASARRLSAIAAISL